MGRPLLGTNRRRSLSGGAVRPFRRDHTASSPMRRRGRCCERLRVAASRVLRGLGAADLRRKMLTAAASVSSSRRCCAVGHRRGPVTLSSSTRTARSTPRSPPRCRSTSPLAPPQRVPALVGRFAGALDGQHPRGGDAVACGAACVRRRVRHARCPRSRATPTAARCAGPSTSPRRIRARSTALLARPPRRARTSSRTPYSRC